MFAFNSLRSRKPSEMVGLRSFSNSKNIHPSCGLNFNLQSINSQKKFLNPNFVNKQNPNVRRCHSSPPAAKIYPGADAPDETGIDPLRMPSSPICIAVRSSSVTDITISITPDSFGCKSRLNSDCASEDSFIVFDCDSDGSSRDEDVSDCGSDSEESDVDQVDFVRQTPYKKVRFSEEPCAVHRMIKWAFAYASARKGPWEQLARDRFRFRDKVSKLAEVIDPILQPGHRNRVFNERFRNPEDP